MAEKKGVRIRITLVRSPLGRKPNQRATVKALGLKKTQSTIVKNANVAVLGMVDTISHLVEVEEL